MLSMKKYKTGLSAILILTSFVLGQGARNGTASASHLLIPQGGKHLSGGGATANATGLDAVYWNPAGLARSANNVDAMFSNRSYIAGININYFGVSAKLSGFGSLALTAKTFDVGEIPVTTVWFPDGTGEKFEPSIFVVAATYSKALTDRTSVGVNFNYVNEGFKRVGASGLTVDAGIQYSSFMNIPNLSIGVVLKNFGTPMQYGGSGLWVQAEATGSERKTDWYKVEAASFDLPFVMDIGANYTLDLGGGNGFDLGFTYENNHFAQDEYRFMGSFNFGSLGSIRGAFHSSADATVEDDPNTTDEDESIGDLTNIFNGVSFGGTLNLKQFTGMDLSIDYAIIPTEYFDTNKVIALRFAF